MILKRMGLNGPITNYNKIEKNKTKRILFFHSYTLRAVADLGIYSNRC